MKRPTFLKWPGGKTALLSKLITMIPKEFNRYFEPFLGGGALFFSIQPNSNVLSDFNPELIQCYKQVADSPVKIIKRLKKMKYTKKDYYQIRSVIPSDSIQKAARFIYLNHCCWNGLYRINKSGEFNVPYGKYKRPHKFFNEENILTASKLLQTAEILSCDFEISLNKCKKEDFVYLDPPYTVKHHNNGFLLYNERIFSWDDQIRLADKVHNLVDNGIKVMVSNANAQEIKDLYKGYNIITVKRSSIISGKNEGRGKITELIITTY